jgi:hypothetical protein
LAQSRKPLAEYIKTAFPLPSTSSGTEYGRSGRAMRTQKDRIMTQFTRPPARGEVEAFIGHVVSDLSVVFSGMLVNVGRKLGLYQAMADLALVRRWPS